MLIILGVFLGIVGLMIAAWTDWKEYRISNQLIAWMFAIGLVFATWRMTHPESIRMEYLWGPVLKSCLLGFGSACMLLIIRLFYDRVRARRKKESKVLIGGGDIKLLAVSSFFFPFNAYVLLLILACVLIMLIEPVRYFFFKKRMFAFAPYMFLSSVVITTFALLNIFGHSA